MWEPPALGLPLFLRRRSTYHFIKIEEYEDLLDLERNPASQKKTNKTPQTHPNRKGRGGDGSIHDQ